MSRRIARACGAFPRVARVALAAALTLSALPAPASALTLAPAAVPSFTLNGRGYGHGIGLSQYGAKGWAEHGKNGYQIAMGYFLGSSIGTAPAKTVYVYLSAAASPDNSGFTHASWGVRAGHSGGKLVSLGHTLPWATYRVEPYGTSLVRVVNASTGTLAVAPTTTVTIAESGGTPNLVEVIDPSGIYNTGRLRHRGTLYFNASGGKLRGVVRLKMDEYLYGVVPRESPSSWPIAALQAQALVARSYAYPGTGMLYCTTRSQAYNGHSSYRSDGTIRMWEAAQTNLAVESTTGKYVKYGGAVVKTYFSSSSGGRTADIQDVWLSATPQPYYRSVADPYDASPYNPWNPPVVIDGKTMAGKVAAKTATPPVGAGTTVWVRNLRFDRAASGHVRRVTVYWSNGAVSTDITGDEFRSALGLRSTVFYTYYFPTTRIAAGDRYATAVLVSRTLYPSVGASSVIVANGEDARFADALTSTGLAGIAKGPVLLVSTTGASSGTIAELKRLRSLGVRKLYIVGGTAVVPLAVQRQVQSAIGVAARRLAGSTRYDTAAAVAREMAALGAPRGTCIVTTGEAWPEAALASSLSAGTRWPVLLANRAGVPGATARTLTALGATRTVLVGGPVWLPSTTVARIRPLPAVRFAINDRAALAAAIGTWAAANAGYSITTPHLVTLARFPDSITGGALAGRARQPLLFANATSLPAATSGFLRANRGTITSVTIIGGTASIGEGAYIAMCTALN